MAAPISILGGALPSISDYYMVLGAALSLDHCYSLGEIHVVFMLVSVLLFKKQITHDIIFIMAHYLGKSQWEFWVHGQHRYDMRVIRLVGIESSYGGPNALAMSIVVSLPFDCIFGDKGKNSPRAGMKNGLNLTLFY